MTEKNRASSGLLPFLLGVGVMAIAGSGFYVWTQQQSSAPTISAVTNSPAPASPAPQSSIATPATDALPPAPAVNLQVNHANGSTARLTQLTIGEDSMTAALTITNGHKHAIKLNNNEGFVITDNFGNQYNLAAPPENADVEIAPGTTLKGQFVFKGRLAPNVYSITIATNNRFGSDSRYSESPKFVFRVPLQGGPK